MIKIDSHLQFWKLSQDKLWTVTDSNDYPSMPRDLRQTLDDINIQGVILVQSTPSLAETYFLLELAKKMPCVFGVVGWIDMLAPDAQDSLAKISSFPKLLGIRAMLEDMVTNDWILKRKLMPCIHALIHAGKTLDLLIQPRHLSNIIQFVSNHPNLKVIIDHGAKPLIKEHHFEPWASSIKILGRHPNVYCKLSGLLTEAGSNVAMDELKPYFDQLFLSFGQERLMWGSDYPKVGTTNHYQYWYELCEHYIYQYAPESYQMVLGGTAFQCYPIHLNALRWQTVSDWIT